MLPDPRNPDLLGDPDCDDLPLGRVAQPAGEEPGSADDEGPRSEDERSLDELLEAAAPSPPETTEEMLDFLGEIARELQEEALERRTQREIEEAGREQHSPDPGHSLPWRIQRVIRDRTIPYLVPKDGGVEFRIRGPFLDLNDMIDRIRERR
jgi:hypothetical protein